MRPFLWIQLANRRLTYKMQQKAYFGHDHEKSSIIWVIIASGHFLDALVAITRSQMKMRAFHVTLCQLCK